MNVCFMTFVIKVREVNVCPMTSVIKVIVMNVCLMTSVIKVRGVNVYVELLWTIHKESNSSLQCLLQ